jgi:hypothetical protein
VIRALSLVVLLFAAGCAHGRWKGPLAASAHAIFPWAPPRGCALVFGGRTRDLPTEAPTRRCSRSSQSVHYGVLHDANGLVIEVLEMFPVDSSTARIVIDSIARTLDDTALSFVECSNSEAGEPSIERLWTFADRQVALYYRDGGDLLALSTRIYEGSCSREI